MAKTLQFDHSAYSATRGNDVGVLVIHGFTGSPHSMRPVSRFFADHGFDVEMPLLPGHGTSWEDMATRKFSEWVDAVDEAYWKLKKRCAQVVVVGLSMGGGLAIHLSARRPVLGTILINPYVVNPQSVMVASPYLKKFVKKMASVGSDIAIPGIDEGAYDITPMSAVAELHRFGVQLRKVIPALTSPVLYFRSENDHIVSDKSHTYFLKKATCPVEFIKLNKSYHVATLDYDAELILETSLQFVRNLKNEKPA